VRRTRRTAEDARQVIRAAAVELFVDGGYGATSLDDIAGKVGLTRQAALYHFRTKEDLLRSVVDPYLQALTSTLDAVSISDPPTAAEQVATLRALVDVLVEHRGVVSLVSRFTTATTTAGIGPELGRRHRLRPEHPRARHHCRLDRGHGRAHRDPPRRAPPTTGPGRGRGRHLGLGPLSSGRFVRR
jgi:AcrR family transcriptional regulator